jgi:ABC-type sulfate/molybdate transport systems ATPase subunit
LLLLDEPYSNLDPLHKKIMQEVVQEIKIRFSVTVILVDHDPSDTLPHADEVLVLQGGRLVQRGTPQTVYREPASAYTARLFGRYSDLPQCWQGQGAVPFLRPEHLSLTSGRLGPLPGKVVQSLFYGNGYEAEVATAEGTLIVRHTDDLLQPEQSVSVFLR